MIEKKEKEKRGRTTWKEKFSNLKNIWDEKNFM